MTAPHFSLLCLCVSTAVLASCAAPGRLQQPMPEYGSGTAARDDAIRAADSRGLPSRGSVRSDDEQNTLLDPLSSPAARAPYPTSLPGRTDPLGPFPQQAGIDLNGFSY
jgi:hypothetical protein